LSTPSPEPPEPLTVVPGGIRLTVRLTPKASRNKIDSVVAEADGSSVLKVAVTTVPEDGKANAAMIALLAKAWKIAKSSITITSGATDRRKTLFIQGDSDDLRRRIAASTAREA